MGPIAAGFLGGALNIFGGLGRNAAIQRQADENYNNTLLALGIQRGVEETNLLFQAQELGQKLGIDLTGVEQEQRKAKGSVVAGATEGNVYGNTAVRLQTQVDKEADIVKANLKQSAKTAATNIQVGLTNAMYQYNNSVYQASQNRANALSQRAGAFEILAGAASSGFNFASGYRSMKGY